jgi:hypothetical protein
MKYELQRLCENLYERRHIIENEVFITYESNGYVSPRQRFIELELTDRADHDGIMNSLRMAATHADDISLCFNGATIESRVIANEEYRTLLGEAARGVKSVQIGSCFGWDRLIQIQNNINGMIAIMSLDILLHMTKSGLEELTMLRYGLTDELALRLCQTLGQVSRLKHLRLIDMACSTGTFAKLVSGMEGKMTNLRYLDISGNEISNEVADCLKSLMATLDKLAYLDVGRCDMQLYGLNQILDGCEITRRMQVLIVERTVAATEAGKNSIEERMISGSLCLLHIQFHVEDGAKDFIRRTCSYMAQRFAERKSIRLVQTKNYSSRDIPDIIESIAYGSDGVENVYKCMQEKDSTLFSEILNANPNNANS